MLDKIFTSPEPIVSIYLFLESSSLFLAKSLFGISWDSNNVLHSSENNNNSNHLEDKIKFLACTLIMCHSIPFWFMNLFYETLQLLFTKKQLAPFRANGALFPERSLVNKAYLYTACFHVVISYFIYNYGARLLLENGVVSSVSVDDLYLAIPNNHNNNHKNGTSSSSFFTSFLTSTNAHQWSFPIYFARLLVCLFVGDFAFYCSHATLHLPFFYEHIHKQHHMFRITCSVAAEYAAPLESIFGNVAVVLAAPFLFRFHAVVWATFLFLAVHSTAMSHSGYWYPSRNLWFHDHHHRVNVGNYSSVGLWDAVFGTDKAWRRMKEKEKQLKLLSGSKSRSVSVS